MTIDVHLSTSRRFFLGLAPIHQRVNKRFWFLTCDVSERRDQLIEIRVHARSTYVFDPQFRIVQAVDAVIYLLVCLAHELVKG